MNTMSAAVAPLRQMRQAGALKHAHIVCIIVCWWALGQGGVVAGGHGTVPCDSGFVHIPLLTHSCQLCTVSQPLREKQKVGRQVPAGSSSLNCDC